MNEKNIWVSWNGNIRHPFKDLYEPASEDEICKIVKSAETVRVFGTKCSSSDIAAGTKSIITLNRYNKILNIDKENLQITVQAGITLEDLIPKIEELGWCIPCLPDIDTITLGGALSTGTHGTARSGQLLSGYIKMFRLINSNGDVLEIGESDDIFEAVRVSLGLLGIISTVTIQCEPIFQMKLTEEPMKDSHWLNLCKSMLDGNDFLRILWLPHTGIGYVIRGNKVGERDTVVPKNGPWFHRYRRGMSKFLYGLTVNVPYLTVWANRILYLLFFRSKIEKSGTLYGASVTKSRGSTLELAEWTIALDRFEETFLDLKKELNSLENNAFAHIPMDIRFIRKDKSWLSYAYEQDTVTIGCVTRNAKAADKYKAFKIIEKVFLRHNGRPHWAKRFSSGSQELSNLYPKWNDFVTLRREMDPSGKFLNEYLKGIFS